MSKAPYDKFLRALRDGDTEAAKLKKLLASYPSLRGGFVTVRKDEGDAVAGTWPRGDFATSDTPPPDDADLEDEEADDERQLNGEDDEETDDNDGEAASKKHFVDTLADLIVAGHEGAITKPQAIRHLLYTPRGAALVRRLHHQKRLQEKEKTMTTTREQDLQQLAKFGPIKLAKHLIENGPSGLSEHEFTAMVESYAKANGTTFVALFEAPDDDGLAIRKCTQLLKRHPRAEGTVSGSALDALWSKATELRKREPNLSREQSFAKAYQNNPELAARERRENGFRRG